MQNYGCNISGRYPVKGIFTSISRRNRESHGKEKLYLDVIPLYKYKSENEPYSACIYLGVNPERDTLFIKYNRLNDSRYKYDNLWVPVDKEIFYSFGTYVFELYYSYYQGECVYEHEVEVHSTNDLLALIYSPEGLSIRVSNIYGELEYAPDIRMAEQQRVKKMGMTLLEYRAIEHFKALVIIEGENHPRDIPAFELGLMGVDKIFKGK